MNTFKAGREEKGMKKITSVRELAIALGDNPVPCELIGKNLNKRVNLWVSRDGAFFKDGMLHR